MRATLLTAVREIELHQVEDPVIHFPTDAVVSGDRELHLRFGSAPLPRGRPDRVPQTRRSRVRRHRHRPRFAGHHPGGR